MVDMSYEVHAAERWRVRKRGYYRGLSLHYS